VGTKSTAPGDESMLWRTRTPLYLHCREICNLLLAGIPPHEVAKVARIQRRQLCVLLERPLIPSR
jgi:hypothetical protein